MKESLLLRALLPCPPPPGRGEATGSARVLLTCCHGAPFPPPPSACPSAWRWKPSPSDGEEEWAALHIARLPRGREARQSEGPQEAPPLALPRRPLPDQDAAGVGPVAEGEGAEAMQVAEDEEGCKDEGQAPKVREG